MTMALNAVALDDFHDEANSSLLTVALVDGQRLFLRGLQVLLESGSGGDIRVIASTDSADNALELARRYQPHIAIVDVSVGTPGGLAAVRDVKRAYPWIRVLATSASDDSEVASASLRAGADGFITKSSDPRGLSAALHSLAGGYCVVPPRVVSELVGAHHDAAAPRLNSDDLRLWRLVAEGLETSDIAQRLSVSERTIKRRIALLVRRLGVSNRVQAAALAGQCGILSG